MNETPEPSEQDQPASVPVDLPPATRGRRVWPWVLLALLVSGAAAAVLWKLKPWDAQPDRAQAEWQLELESLRARIEALDRELDGARERQRQIEARMGQQSAGLAVAREELLGLAERSRRIEDAVSALSQMREEGRLDLQLDDLELLLEQARLRGELLADHAAAARALEHAAALLARIDHPAYAALRAPLEAERQALAELGPDPRPALRQQITGLIELVSSLPWRESEMQAESPSGLLKLLEPLIRVRRLSEADLLLSPIERATRRASLELSLELALAALETGDEDGWRHQLRHAREQIRELFDPDATAVTAAVQILDEAIRQPLRVDGVELGVTLRELRAMRATLATGRGAPPAPPELRIEQP